MRDWKAIFENSLTEVHDLEPIRTRLEYLGDHIFQFTTYDGEMSELFARKAVEVCKAIATRKTFQYIEAPENYRWYLLLMNTPFFADRTQWGTSIRGAWWGPKHYGKPIQYTSCGIYDGQTQLHELMDFTVPEWEAFIQAIIDFAEPEMSQPVAEAA